MLVDAVTGQFLTQRTIPSMALIEPHLPFEALADWGAPLPADAVLTVTAPGMPAPLRVPLCPLTSSSTADRTVSCWEWKGQAADEGDAAAQWFSAFLGRPCRLVRHVGAEQPAHRRVVDPAYAPAGQTFITAFTDGYPVLVISEPSLRDMNDRIEEPVKMNRFRPNLVIGGNRPFEEDEWVRLSIGDASFESVKPCSRCKVTTTDQETAQVHERSEPLRSLAGFRTGKDLALPEPAWRNEIFVGWNLLPVGGVPSRIKVGDTVRVSARR